MRNSLRSHRVNSLLDAMSRHAEIPTNFYIEDKNKKNKKIYNKGQKRYFVTSILKYLPLHRRIFVLKSYKSVLYCACQFSK